MSEPPPNPWIRFPDLLRDPHPPAEAIAQLADWYAFLPYPFHKTHLADPDRL
jgi:hypothetical protein